MESKEKQKPVTYVSGLGYLPATPKLTERRNLTMRYHLVILSTMLVLGLWLVLLPPFQVLTAHLGFSSWEGELMARMFTLLCAYLPASLILWLCGDRSKGVVGVKKAMGIRYGYALGIGLGMSALARLLTAGGLWLMRVTTPFYYEQETAPQPESLGGFVLELTALVLLPVLLEEFFFRGLVIGRLKEFGELVAVLVSAVLYAILSPTLDQLVFRLFLGLVLGLVRLRSFSVLVPMVVSAGVSLVWLCLDWLSLPFYIAGVLLLLLIGMGSVALWSSKHLRAFQNRDWDTNLTNRAKINLLITNFFFWILIVVGMISLVTQIQIIG